MQQQEISCYHHGDDGRAYVLVYGGDHLHGGEGDDVLVLLAPSYYNGGPGTDTFNCPPGPGDIVQDYNLGEGDTVSADCEAAAEGATPSEPIRTDLTFNAITSVPWSKDMTVITGKLADASQAGGVGRKTITFDSTGAENIPDVITNTDGTFTAKCSSSNMVATGWTYQAGLIYLDLTGKYFASTKGREYLKRFEELNCSENDILEKRRLLISLLEGGDMRKTC
jgi:hypothetical protein